MTYGPEPCRRLLLVSSACAAVVVAVPVVARQWLRPDKGATLEDITRWLLVLIIRQSGMADPAERRIQSRVSSVTY